MRPAMWRRSGIAPCAAVVPRLRRFGGSTSSARTAWGSGWGRRALALLAGATVALAVAPAAQAALVFDGSPGSGAPPATLGGFTMVPSPQDARANFTAVTTAPATPTSSFSFDRTMSLRTIGSFVTGWCSSNWAGGSYGGRIYWTEHGSSVKITLPSPASAVYLYGDREQFGTNNTMEATASNGTTSSSGPIATANYLCGGTNPPSGQFFGFYGTGGEKIASVTLSTSGPIPGFAVGDFALASGTSPTTVTTSLSGEEGQKGERITVKEGEGATDQATLSGKNAAKATGTVKYKIYSDNQCSNLVREAGTVSVTNGKMLPSESEKLAGGVNYHWQAEYSGDGENEASKSACTEVELVLAVCGKTTVGKSSDQLLADIKRVNACKLPFNADITELVFYLAPTSHSGTQLIKGVLYEDEKGKPGKLLGETGKFTFSSGEKAGWHHFLFATPVNVPKGNCWIGVITGKSSLVAGERFDSVANAEDYNANNYLSGASKSFGPFKPNNEQMSLYAGFTREPG